MTTTGTLLSGAFGLVGRRPGAVLVWVIIHAAFGLATAALLARTLPEMFAMLSQLDPKNPEAAQQMALMSGMGNIQALSWLLSLVGYFVSALLLCAAFRAVLRPEDGGFAALRLGWDELRTFLMILVIGIGGTILAVIAFLIVFVVAMLLFFALRDAPAIAVALCVLLWIAALAATLYVAVRLSLIFAVSFLRGRLTIDEAWAVTRGRFWTLFLAYLVIALAMWVLSSLVFVPFAWSLFAAVAALPPATGETATPQQMAAIGEWIAGNLVPFGAMVAALSGLQGLSTALTGGAMATAARGFLEGDGLIDDGANS